jgi:hypothetical protein
LGSTHEFLVQLFFFIQQGAHQHQQASQQIPSLMEQDEVDLEEHEAQVNVNPLPVSRLVVYTPGKFWISVWNKWCTGHSKYRNKTFRTII